MREHLIFKNENNKPILKDDTLKITALLYLKEALITEQYEKCAELIRKAKRFGAQQEDISHVIAGYVQERKGKLPNEANQNDGGRPRF